MSAFQVAFIVVAAVQVVGALRRFARGHHAGSILYAAMWMVAVVVVQRPELSTHLARMFGIGRGVDLVTYALLSLFLWAHYQQYLRYRRLDQHITVLVREVAMATAVRPETAPSGTSASHVSAR
jgi:small membrane protein